MDVNRQGRNYHLILSNEENEVTRLNSGVNLLSVINSPGPRGAKPFLVLNRKSSLEGGVDIPASTKKGGREVGMTYVRVSPQVCAILELERKYECLYDGEHKLLIEVKD